MVASFKLNKYYLKVLFLLLSLEIFYFILYDFVNNLESVSTKSYINLLFFFLIKFFVIYVYINSNKKKFITKGIIIDFLLFFIKILFIRSYYKFDSVIGIFPVYDHFLFYFDFISFLIRILIISLFLNTKIARLVLVIVTSIIYYLIIQLKLKHFSTPVFPFIKGFF